jgi:hypothetical protein
MRRLRMLYFALIGILMSAMPVFAQAVEDNANSVNKYKAIAAGFGFALAAGLGALG